MGGFFFPEFLLLRGDLCSELFEVGASRLELLLVALPGFILSRATKLIPPLLDVRLLVGEFLVQLGAALVIEPSNFFLAVRCRVRRFSAEVCDRRLHPFLQDPNCSLVEPLNRGLIEASRFGASGIGGEGFKMCLKTVGEFGEEFTRGYLERDRLESLAVVGPDALNGDVEVERDRELGLRRLKVCKVTPSRNHLEEWRRVDLEFISP